MSDGRANGERILAVVLVPPGGRGISLEPLAGQPLAAWTFATAAACRGVFGRVMVATSDFELARLAQSRGLEAPLRLPTELAADEAAPAAVLAYCLTSLERRGGEPFDWVCLISAAHPLLAPADLERAVALARGEADSVAAVVAAQESHPLFLKKIAERRLLPYAAAEKEGLRPAEAKPAAFLPSPALALVRRAPLLERASLRGAAARPLLLAEENAVAADSPAALALCDRLLRRRHALPAPAAAPVPPAAARPYVPPAAAPPALSPPSRPAAPAPLPPVQAPPIQPPPVQPPAAAAAAGRPGVVPLYIPPDLPLPDSSGWLRGLAGIAMTISFLILPPNLLQTLDDQDMIKALHDWGWGRGAGNALVLMMVGVGFLQVLYWAMLGELTAWTHGVYQNLSHLGRETSTTPEGAAARFWIPLYNCFAPYHTFSELWRESGPPDDDGVPLWLPLWWLIGLAAGLLNLMVTATLAMVLLTGQLGTELPLFQVAALFHGCAVVAVAILLHLIKRIEERQKESWAARAAVRQLPPASQLEDRSAWGPRHVWRFLCSFLLVAIPIGLPLALKSKARAPSLPAISLPAVLTVALTVLLLAALILALRRRESLQPVAAPILTGGAAPPSTGAPSSSLRVGRTIVHALRRAFAARPESRALRWTSFSFIIVPMMQAASRMPPRFAQSPSAPEPSALMAVLPLVPLFAAAFFARRWLAALKTSGGRSIPAAWAAGPWRLPLPVFFGLLALTGIPALASVPGLGHFLAAASPALHRLWLLCDPGAFGWLAWVSLAALIRLAIFQIENGQPEGLRPGEKAEEGEP